MNSAHAKYMRCILLLMDLKWNASENAVLLITARKRSLGQGNIFTPVCHSVHGGGGSTWPGTPPDQVHPPRDQVHPPGPGTPQDQVHPPGTRYTPRDQVHPPGTSEIRSTRGRYASYWNAILFSLHCAMSIMRSFVMSNCTEWNTEMDNIYVQALLSQLRESPDTFDQYVDYSVH